MDWQIVLQQVLAFWWLESLIILVFLFPLLYAWLRVYRMLVRLAQKTRTLYDEIFIRALNAPFIFALVLSMFCLALAPLDARFDLAFFAAGEVLPYILTGAFFWFCLTLVGNCEKVLLRRRLKEDQTPRPPSTFVDTTTLHILTKFLRAVVLILLVLTLLSMAGVSISGLLAFGGISGIIVGLAVRETLANFFSGILIFWERPFVVGDWIRCPTLGIEGVVEEINWRVTKVRNFEKRPLYVPNAMFMNNYVENPQRMTHRRFRERIGIRYEDLNKLPAILQEIRAMIDEHEKTDTAQKWVVGFDEYGDSALIFFISVVTPATDWREFHQIKEEILFKMAAIVHKHGADFAFPTRRVLMESSTRPRNDDGSPPTTDP